MVFIDDKMLGSVSFPNHEEFAPARDLTLTVNVSVDKLLQAKADGDHSAGMNLLAWNEGDGHWMIGEHANSSGRRPIRITTNLNTTTHGRATAQVGGELYLYKGCWIGNTSQARFFRGFTQEPTSGEVSRGDKYWNYNPAEAGAPAGWRVVTGGVLGSTAVLEEYFYAPNLPGDHPGYTLRPKSDGGSRVQWREAAKAGTDTIADAASTVVVAFTNALANANYAVALSVDGDERVWVTSKTASGFTINRAASAGARAVDWTATPHEDL